MERLIENEEISIQGGLRVTMLIMIYQGVFKVCSIIFSVGSH